MTLTVLVICWWVLVFVRVRWLVYWCCMVFVYVFDLHLLVLYCLLFVGGNCGWCVVDVVCC